MPTRQAPPLCERVAYDSGRWNLNSLNGLSGSGRCGLLDAVQGELIGVKPDNIALVAPGPRTGCTMTNMEGVSNLLHVCSRKTEEFLWVLENKHMLWLLEIGEEARKMFSTDFNAEPELMPKTPSQKRRRKKRTSVVPDENRDPNVRRSSRRRSSSSWSTSVRRLSTRIQKPVDASIQEEPEKPKRMTRAKAQTSILCPPVPEKPLPESPKVSQDLQVKITAEERRSADLQLADAIPNTEEKTEEPIPEISISLPVTPDAKCHSIAKLSLTKASTPKQDEDETQAAKPQPIELDAEQPLDPKDRTTPTGSRSDRRSVRRSLVGWQSTSHRASLVTQYSLASKRESMTREAVRKSMRRSISKKRAMENSSSSSRSYQSSVDEDTIKVRPEPEISLESPVPQSGRLSLRSRTCKKIAISNQPEDPQRDTQPATDTDMAREFDDPQMKRRKSYKRAVDELSDDEQREGEELSPPRKKTPSPPCPPSKVVKPPPHMKSFLHTVQKNQLLMMTPGSIGKNIMVKSFIKRNTPLKTDPKIEEKERLKQEALRKKEETELLRKQKVQEEKKRKQEELKLRREERLRKVLQARERVEQIEEEKKKKIEQKFAQIDEKSEKVKEDRIAEEKAKKKITAKKQEEVESRRKQEEETRRLKAKQMEEDERKYQEQIQKKREEEEQERQKKILEAKRLAEQKQAEQERERQREQQQAAEREQERQRAEKERAEKERLLQLQRELERAAQLKEQLRKEVDERKIKEEQERLEKLHKEQEAKRLQEEQERKAKEQAEASTAPALNVTVDIRNSPACESYQMTPQSYKVPVPKIDPENYGMDLNSDDSTDDESQPRKPIPPWASGNLLGQAIRKQYYNPIDVDRLFGTIDSPKLEDMFYKSKPRYFKRTSSAVWHSPPLSSNRHHLAVGYGLKKY